MEIRIFSIQFAKRKAKKKRSTELDLLRSLENLNSRIEAAPEDIYLISKARKLKIKLHQIAVRKVHFAKQGAMV